MFFEMFFFMFFNNPNGRIRHCRSSATSAITCLKHSGTVNARDNARAAFGRKEETDTDRRWLTSYRRRATQQSISTLIILH